MRIVADMGAFEQRYTERQRQAVAIAQVDRGLTARLAVEQLMAGQLRDKDGPVPAPENSMPLKTAHGLSRKMKDEREGRRGRLDKVPADVARNEMLRRLCVAADNLTRRVEAKSKSGARDPHLADSLTKAAKAVAAVITAQKAAEDPKNRDRAVPSNGAPPSPEPVDSSPLASIARNLEAEDRSRSRRPAQS